MKQIASLLAAVVLLASCQQYDKTKSGMAYKKIKSGSAVKLKQGQIMKFDIEIKVSPKDTVWSSTLGHIPAYDRYDTARLGKYNFTELFPMAHIGDKFKFQLSVDSLKKQGQLEYNKIFVKGGTIDGTVEILKAFDSEQEATADYTKETDVEKARETKALQDYATKKGLKVQQTKNGALVVVTTPGDAQKADSGKQVSVMYKGYTVDGKEFDSNMDTAAHKPPFTFVVGTHGAIQGWDEGLPYFGKGGKGKLLVPGMLAYGPRGSGPIPAYGNLVFDIEVVDVTTPPPPAPAPPQVMPLMPKGNPQAPKK
ncbi:FKBP-type peptidyl-prolyl cis-trans isomerase [Chitinophagaceae bacterium LWZ2-11]